MVFTIKRLLAVLALLLLVSAYTGCGKKAAEDAKADHPTTEQPAADDVKADHPEGAEHPSDHPEGSEHPSDHPAGEAEKPAEETTTEETK